MKIQISKLTRPLRKVATLTALALAAIGVFAVHAVVLNYGYVSLSSIQTSPEVIWPSAVGTTLRLVSYDITSDTNIAVVRLYGGTAQYYMVGTNSSTGTNFVVASNVGLSSNDTVIIQMPDNTAYSAAVYSTNQTTNVTIQASIGAAQVSGAILYKMGTIHTNAMALSGAGTAFATNLVKHSTAIFAAQTKMPLMIRVTPGLTKASINSATAVYDLSQ